MRCDACGSEYDNALDGCPHCAGDEQAAECPDRDYVTCGWCGFVGPVPRGCQNCPDCGGHPVDPMSATGRRAYDEGTLTHLEDNFDNMCGYTGAYSRMRRAKLRGGE